MKRSILLVSAMVMATGWLHAQVFIGPKAGVALSNYKYADGEYADNYNSLLRPGIQAGIVLELPFSSSFSMQLEGIYVQKGGVAEPNANGKFAGEECKHESLPYLSIPLFFKYRIQGRPLGGFISAGSELSFAFSGKKWEGTSKADRRDKIEVGSGSNDQYKNSDIGFLVGGGLSYDVNIGELILDARYVLGMRNINGETIDSQKLESTRNRSLQVSLGIIFPFGG